MLLVTDNSITLLDTFPDELDGRRSLIVLLYHLVFASINERTSGGLRTNIIIIKVITLYHFIIKVY